MGFVHCASVFLVLTILGIENSRACNETIIMTCGGMIAATARSFFVQKTGDLNTVCRAANQGVKCISNDVTNCPAKYAPYIEEFNNASHRLVQQCQDTSKIDQTAVMACPFDATGQCIQASISQDQDPKAQCLSYGKMIKCIDEFKTNCKSNFAKDVVSTAFFSFGFSIQDCHDQGYPTDNAAGHQQQMVIVPLLASVLAVSLRYLM